MLQPLQLKDVSVRYANEIAELRDFLTKANCAVGTEQTLGGIVTRLKGDRAFHRDLTSHIWVVMDRCEGISYSDLLGVLAIAAAGANFAAATDEDDAHRLLRFLMEAHHSLDSMSHEGEEGDVHRAAGAIAHPSAQPLRSVTGDRQEAPSGAVTSAHKDLLFQEEPQKIGDTRRRVGWAIAAGLVILVLSMGLWMKTKRAKDASNTQASITSAAVGSSFPPVTPTSANPSTLEPIKAAPTADVAASSGRRKSRVGSFSTAARSSHKTLATSPAISSRAVSTPPQGSVSNTQTPVSAPATPLTLTPSAIARPPIPSATPAPVRTGTASPPAASVAGTPSSGRVGTASTSPGLGDIARNSKAPNILHRRVPMSGEFAEDGAYLKPEASPADTATAPGSNHNGSAGTTVVGTIRITSLGVMAGNIVYSPLPTYPAAAFASHVQGEVKVMADVSRDGTVASARVISGPPLLRSAALDAIQRWRYRPYMSSGGPTPTTAVAVMDFQLP